MLIVIGGLFVGYWLVASILRGLRNTKKDSFSQANFAKSVPKDSPKSRDKFEPESSQTEQKPPSWNEVLGVTPFASSDEVRGAYRKLVSQYHPDKVAALGPELRELATRKSQEINWAYREWSRQTGVND